MIALDTSALMAIALGESQAESCAAALASEDRVLMSATTLAEALIVADRRGVASLVEAIVDRLGVEIVPVTPAVARRVADAYAQWGRGLHPAGLNFGDCFTYETAKSASCPLLFVGDDFSRTDLLAAIPPSSIS